MLIRRKTGISLRKKAISNDEMMEAHPSLGVDFSFLPASVSPDCETVFSRFFVVGNEKKETEGTRRAGQTTSRSPHTTYGTIVNQTFGFDDK